MEDVENHIFKVALSLGSLSGKTFMLVYNADRSIEYQTEVTPEILGMFTLGESKIYVEGLYDNNTNMILLGKRVEDQPW